MERAQKRVAAVHDISGFGRCSLTVALPIISAAGVECSVVPTAVLSTHTGKIEGYTFRDLTSDLPAFVHHWEKLGIEYDALYSGYLGSKEQIPIMSDLFSYYKKQGAFILIDPVMGDDGNLYAGFDTDFVSQMTDLCMVADLITPNMTEVNLFLGEPFEEGPYKKEEIEDKLRRLHLKLGIPYIVMTGVYFNDKELGAAIYSAQEDKVHFVMGPHIEGWFHGTGDMFASALLGAYMNGFDLTHSAQIAVDYTSAAIIRTAKENTDRRFGVNFEQTLPVYLKALGLI